MIFSQSSTDILVPRPLVVHWSSTASHALDHGSPGSTCDKIQFNKSLPSNSAEPKKSPSPKPISQASSNVRNVVAADEFHLAGRLLFGNSPPLQVVVLQVRVLLKLPQLPKSFKNSYQWRCISFSLFFFFLFDSPKAKPPAYANNAR